MPGRPAARVDPDVEVTAQVPHLILECQAWASGARWVVGVDEVGRGALAGPVAVGAVVLPQDEGLCHSGLAAVRDSKLLSPDARAELCRTILAAAAAVAVALVGPLAVDVLGIANAVRLGARRAIAALPMRCDLALVDGPGLRGLPVPQRAIIGGDRSVLSIACASVFAKAFRDAWMIGMSLAHPAYGFEAHKGYLTAYHRAAIAAFGPTCLHRLTWAPLRDLRVHTYGAALPPIVRLRLAVDEVVAFRAEHP